MENPINAYEGGEQSSFLSDKNFEDFFLNNIMNISTIFDEKSFKNDDEGNQQFSNGEVSDYNSDSFEQQNEERKAVPNKKNQEKEITFDPESGTLECTLGVFQHLQYLLPEHPIITETKINDKWSRINEAVRKFFSKSGENVSYISLSPKSEHSDIYKLIKKSKFLKQRNSYLLISVDKKDELEKFLDQRLKNKRKSKRKIDEEPIKKDKCPEPTKKIKVDKVPLNKPQQQNDLNVDPKFRNLLFIDLNQTAVVKNQDKVSHLKITVEGESKNDVDKVIPLISPSFSSFDFNNDQRKDIEQIFLSPNELEVLKKKNLGDLALPFNPEKLQKHGLNEKNKDAWIDFVEKFICLPKLCKSSHFSFNDDLSSFSQSLIQFSEQFFTSNKKLFECVNLKSVSSSTCQILRIPTELFALIEKLYKLRKQIKNSLDNFQSYENISKSVSEEYILRVDVSNKIKDCFAYLLKNNNSLVGNFFFEEYLLNFSVCGSKLLVKEDKVEIIGNFDEHDDYLVSPSRFFQDLLSKTSLEIGQALRFFLKANKSLCVSLRFYASNLDLNSQPYLFDLNFSQDFNLIPFVTIPSLQPNQFLFISHLFHKGDVVDKLHIKFPFQFNKSSFPGIQPHINRVLFLPQQNLTRVDYSLLLESERLITNSSSSFKQILNTLL